MQCIRIRLKNRCIFADNVLFFFLKSNLFPLFYEISKLFSLFLRFSASFRKKGKTQSKSGKKSSLVIRDAVLFAVSVSVEGG